MVNKEPTSKLIGKPDSIKLKQRFKPEITAEELFVTQITEEDMKFNHIEWAPEFDYKYEPEIQF